MRLRGRRREPETEPKPPELQVEQVDRRAWWSRVCRYSMDGTWDAKWGPAPRERTCVAPKSVLWDFGWHLPSSPGFTLRG